MQVISQVFEAWTVRHCDPTSSWSQSQRLIYDKSKIRYILEAQSSFVRYADAVCCLRAMPLSLAGLQKLARKHVLFVCMYRMKKRRQGMRQEITNYTKAFCKRNRTWQVSTSETDGVDKGHIGSWLSVMTVTWLGALIVCPCILKPWPNFLVSLSLFWVSVVTCDVMTKEWDAEWER